MDDENWVQRSVKKIKIIVILAKNCKMLFEPKPKEQILQDLATSNYVNRNFLIDFYTKSPDKFDKLFDLICKAPEISLEHAKRAFKFGNQYGPINYDSAIVVIKIFKFLGWNNNKTYKIESARNMDGYERFYLIEVTKKKE